MTDYSDPRFYVQDNFCKYDPATGAILFSGTMSVGAIHKFMDEGEAYVVGEGNVADHYVDVQTLQVKEKMLFPGRLVGLQLLDLPIPCKLRIDWQTYDVTDGTVDLTFPFADTYKIEITSPRYKTGNFEVNYEG